MKIVVTGALGGIGRSLIQALGQHHQPLGIVRSAPAGADAHTSYVAFSDEPAIRDAFSGAGAVVHAALDSKARGQAFLDINLAMNRSVLKRAIEGGCPLFVFISSQVVYSGISPPDAEGYRESQTIGPAAGLDRYTRLKIQAEADVVAACEAAGIGWLIVRPTIVLGPGMGWSDGAAGRARWLTPAIGGRTMNVVHVDDVSQMIRTLIESGARNDIFNLGSLNVSSTDYFRALGQAARSRALFIPNSVVRAAGPLVPSTFWFFRRPVAVNCEKIARVMQDAKARPLETMFMRGPRRTHGSSFDALKAAHSSADLFRAHGQNYTSWFIPFHDKDSVSLGAYAGVLSLEAGLVTVKAGTRLEEICEFLHGEGRALPTLPEFLGISAGACFFVDVHGSSGEYFSLLDIIERVKYLGDDGAELVAERGDANWAELRARRERFIVTEVTFQTVPTSFLANRIGWVDEATMDALLDEEWRSHLSTTIQWYPRQRKLMIYRIDPVPAPPGAPAKAVTPFRGLPYHAQRLFLAFAMGRRDAQIDTWHNILGPWRRVPFEQLVVRYWVERGRPLWSDMEMCLELGDGRALIGRLRELMARRQLGYRSPAGIGIRFSHDRKEGRDYAWIELHGDANGLEEVARLAQSLARHGVRFHRGKYVPPAGMDRSSA